MIPGSGSVHSRIPGSGSVHSRIRGSGSVHSRIPGSGSVHPEPFFASRWTFAAPWMRRRPKTEPAMRRYPKTAPDGAQNGREPNPRRASGGGTRPDGQDPNPQAPQAGERRGLSRAPRSPNHRRVIACSIDPVPRLSEPRPPGRQTTVGSSPAASTPSPDCRPASTPSPDYPDCQTTTSPWENENPQHCHRHTRVARCHAACQAPPPGARVASV